MRWLGWAGVELEAEGERLVIDLLGTPEGVLAGTSLEPRSLPAVVPPSAPAGALAGLCTHLHRDHADAHALRAALRPDAPVFVPASFGGDDHENLWTLAADHELRSEGLRRVETPYWQQHGVGPFVVSAVPAVDTLGDPQVSWAVEAGGARVLHLGDSMYHGYWWRAARRFGPFDMVFTPINGPRVCFPHCDPPSPFPAALDATQAAVAGGLLGASTVVPIHYDGFHVDGHYETSSSELEDFLHDAERETYTVLVPGLGDWHDVPTSR